MRYHSSGRKTINQEEWVEGPLVISFDVQAGRRDERRRGREMKRAANAVYRSIVRPLSRSSGG